MHRVKILVFSGLMVLMAASLLSACAAPTFEMRDTAEVEALRLRITKVRNAIDETRHTIARSRGAHYLPELYLRLAELLSEEARYHYQLATMRERGEGEDLYVPEVRLLKNEAIEIYQNTIRRFPDSPEAPRMLFNMGHEHRELGDFDDMRTTMQRLIAEYPNHQLRFQAMIVLGDFEFDQNEMEEAAHYYAQITGAELSAASGLAHYKMAWVRINQGECDTALDEFEDAMEKTSNWASERDRRRIEEERAIDSLPGVDQSVDVRRNSLADLAYCYSQERQPDDALAYYQKWSDNRSDYVNGLGRLARRYRLLDEYEGARDLSRELLRHGASTRERLDDGRTLYSTLSELEDYDTIADDVRLINSSLTRYHGQIAVDRQTAAELFDEFEVYIRDLVTSAQEAMKEESGARQQELAREAADAYRAHLDTYLDSEERAAMMLNLAEVLVVTGEHFRAGQQSLAAANILEDEQEKRDALYDAVVQFQASLERESERSQYESVVARAAVRSAGQRLLLLDLDDERARRVKFAIAESHFDAGEYDEAIDKLALVAYEHPGTTQAEEAIRLVLDSYLTITDYDGLIYASRRFLASGSPASSDLQADIREILEAAEQKKIDVLTLAAAGDDGVELTPLRDFADIHRGTELGERALLNAFVAARSSGDTPRMYELAEEIAQVYPHSEELAGIFSSLAQTAAARFEYDEAIDFLEQAATNNPDRRSQYLTAAGELRDELREYDAAEALYRQAISASEGAGGRASALGRFSTLLERHNSPRQLAGDLIDYSEDGQPEVIVRLGLAELARGNPNEAASYFQQVLGATTMVSAEAEARAHYGLAEVMLATLKSFPELSEIAIIQEFITLMDITQQNYLNAARQGSQRYTTVSLSRLAFALQFGAQTLERTRLPSDLEAAQRNQLEAAIAGRVENLRATAEEALGACASRMWDNYLFDDVVQRCLRGEPWDAVLASYQTPRPRRSASLGEDAEILRERVARDGQDVDSLRTLGQKFLDGGDAHLARLVFHRAVQAGGGGTELNLQGLASQQMGDTPAAFESFARAARAGSDEGRQNLANLLRESGHPDLAEEVFERYQDGEE